MLLVCATVSSYVNVVNDSLMYMMMFDELCMCMKHLFLVPGGGLIHVGIMLWSVE